jgi:ADP-ribose pyrophosphatase YjhB (NUDIX family)
MIPGKDYVGLGVGAVIVREGKVLMLLRSDACRNNRGMWTIPGGMVETSEGLEDAVRREVMEETGLHVTYVEFLCVSDRFFDGEHWVSILYRCGTEGEPSNIEPEKHKKIDGRTWTVTTGHYITEPGCHKCVQDLACLGQGLANNGKATGIVVPCFSVLCCDCNTGIWWEDNWPFMVDGIGVHRLVLLAAWRKPLIFCQV